MSVNVKRIYEAVAEQDDYRVLVDRLWPRGIKKEAAGIDVWLKEVAPTTELRKWFHKDMDNWAEFSKKYRAELKINPAWKELQKLVKAHKKITLLYASKDETRNHALLLAKLLQ